MNNTLENKLDFCVIGAQKCATSWLYYCLREHPEISVPSKKLEAGYIGGAMYAEKGEDWFFSRFKTEGSQIQGDVSVEYLYDRNTPNALMPFVKSNTKIIICLRNPTDRLVSGYFWLLRKGVLPNVPLEKGISAVLDQPNGFPNTLDEPLEEVVRRSCYGPQVNRFIDIYGPENIFIYLFEDVAEDSYTALQKVYEFLDVDSNFSPPSINSAPKKNSYNRVLLAIENSINSKLVAKLCNYAHQAITYFADRKDALPKKLRLQLDTIYEPTIEDTIASVKRVPANQRPSEEHIRARWGLR